MTLCALLLTTFLSLVLGGNYILDAHENCRNVVQNTSFLTLLGTFKTLQECQNACATYGNSSYHCDSYTYNNNSNQPDSNECYTFVNNTLWLPKANQNNWYCGRVIYPCQSDWDCSLNGVCNTQTGNCTCDPAWNGYKCGNMTFLPAINGTGYNMTDNGEHTSSWGGSIQYNKAKNVYNMLVAELEGIYVHQYIFTTKIIH